MNIATPLLDQPTAEFDVTAAVRSVIGEPAAAELDALLQAGEELMTRGQTRPAADALRLVALADPLRTEAWHALAACHEQDGDHAAAADIYELGYCLGGEDEPLGLLAVRARLRAGDADAALALLDAIEECAAGDDHETARAALRSLIQRSAP